MTARLRVPWPLVASQWWRWRHPRLWRGRTFAPHNSQQVMSYAVLRLRRETRDVFLLNHIKALDYALIARHLGLSVADVQRRAWGDAVLARTGLSRSTLYRKIRDGSFPEQVRISIHGAGWRESAINRWIANPAGYRRV